MDNEQASDLRMVASTETLALITAAAAAADDEYIKLYQQIISGWPESPTDVDANLRPYMTFADELSVSCGLVFKGHRIVIPGPARNDILNRLHSAHTGVNSCQRRARETVYWPGITTDIKQLIERCQICCSFQEQTQKEPLMSYPAPSRPWQKVGVDIFTIADRHYLVTVDFLSGYFEIDRLHSMTVADIIYCLKQHFARHGLPEEVVSDNSPFGAAEFARFAKLYEFKHTTSSPHWHQSNGRSENGVKIAKRLLLKAHADKADPFIALLEWRNTPGHLGSSPAQMIFGRRTRTKLPLANKLLETPTSAAASDALRRVKERQALYYNRGAKPRDPLVVGDTVRFKFNERTPEWRKAEITEVLPHRSYKLRSDDGSIYRRTSRHVRLAPEPQIVIFDNSTNDEPDQSTKVGHTEKSKRLRRTAATHTAESQLPSQPTQPPPPQQTVVTRSGRVVRKPARYED